MRLGVRGGVREQRPGDEALHLPVAPSQGPDSQGPSLPLPRLRGGVQRDDAWHGDAAGAGRVRGVRGGLRGPRQVGGPPGLHPFLRRPRRRLRRLLRRHRRVHRQHRVAAVPARRVHGRRRRAAPPPGAPHLLDRRHPGRAHVQEMRPHPMVVSFLKVMTNIIPTWKIVPTADVIDAAYKMQEKRDEIRNNEYCYKGNPRLKTAYELLRVSLNLENNVLAKVSLPFLIVHGGDDKVTDPAVSDLLFRSAVSQDKMLNLYPGMWHALTSGETPENIHTVFQDIIAWLDERSSSTKSSAEGAVDMSSELEQKAKHDEQSSEMEQKAKDDEQPSEMEQKAMHDEQSSETEQKAKHDEQSSETEQKDKHDEQSSEMEQKAKHDGQSLEMEEKAKHDEQSSEMEQKAKHNEESSEIEQKAKHDEQSSEMEQKAKHDEQSSEMEQKAKHDEQQFDKL